MSKITGIWLHRDGAPAAELTPRAGLAVGEWSQLPLPSSVLWLDPHDFEDRITDPPPETR